MAHLISRYGIKSNGGVTEPAAEHVAILRHQPAERDAERHEHADEHEQQPVDRPLERRARMPELARLPRDARGVALLADCSHEIRAGALDGERARSHLFARVLRHRLRLARQDRLVEREPVAAPQRSVGDDLVARVEQHDVALDDLLDADAPRLAVAQHVRGGRDERGEAVERSLRAHLLRDADARRSRRGSRGRSRPARRRTTSVRTPAASRIRLKTVKTFATTMLLYERLDASSAGGLRGELALGFLLRQSGGRGGRRHGSSVAAT